LLHIAEVRQLNLALPQNAHQQLPTGRENKPKDWLSTKDAGSKAAKIPIPEF